MHPAPSVIFFTAFSGLGFGLLAWLGLGLPPVSGWVAFTFYVLAYGMAVGGLLASVFHLGNKKNAVKAFSQWRSSWLSREGIMAPLTLIAMAPYAFAQTFLDTTIKPLGLIGAILCLITVFTTSMIYTQLKTVPRWNTPFTPLLFLLFSVAGGALLAGQVRAAIGLLAALGVLQVLAWMQGDARGQTGDSTIESATGLGRIGKTRLLEPPHSGQNYLLKEMAYTVGRRHAFKLRLIALLFAVVLPVLLLLALPVTHMVALVAVLSHLVGLLAARWLFFAEAAHVVRLYYGK